jgi:hypothetical protein
MYYRVFDVAKWSTGDIEGIMVEEGIELTGQAHIDFVEAVITFLDRYFDATIGINWDVIRDAILDVAQEKQITPKVG